MMDVAQILQGVVTRYVPPRHQIFWRLDYLF